MPFFKFCDKKTQKMQNIFEQTVSDRIYLVITLLSAAANCWRLMPRSR